MENIIKIVEQNVDGCGGSAEMFASCSEPITRGILNELEGLLTAVKKEVISEDWDTEAMVNEAVRRSKTYSVLPAVTVKRSGSSVNTGGSVCGAGAYGFFSAEYIFI